MKFRYPGKERRPSPSPSPKPIPIPKPDENSNVESTMETVAGHVGLLLDAKPYEEMFEFCDFSLADQVGGIPGKGGSFLQQVPY